MKSACLLSFVLLSAFASVAAQDRPARNNALPPVQAPPTLEDPGTPAVTPPVASAPKSATAGGQQTEAAAKPAESPGLPDDVQAAAEAAELPVVTVRQQGADTVEEYRKRGKLYFVRVLSQSGPPKFYVDSPGAVPVNVMQQLSGPSGVVQPVYFKLADWK